MLSFRYFLGSSYKNSILTCVNVYVSYWSREKSQINLYHTFLLGYMQIFFIISLAQCSKLLFGQILYVTTIQDDPSDSTVSNLSRYFCAFDNVSTFFLQWNLLLIPYTWCKNVVKRLNYLQIQKKYTKYALAFVHVYMFARIFIHFLLTLFEVMADGVTFNKNLCAILNGFVILDAFFCMMVLFFGLFTLFSNFKELKLNDKRDKKKLLTQFFLMIGVCLIRFIVDITFLLVPSEILLSASCIGTQNILKQLIFTCVYFAGGILLTHIMPVVLILQIYRLKKKQTIVINGNSDSEISEAFT